MPDSLEPTSEIKSQEREGNLLFPVFLKLETLKLLVVGGGLIGHEKLSAVLRNSPATQVTVVATWISDEVKALVAEYSNVVLIEKPYDHDDLDDKDLVIVATDNRDLSEIIKKETKKRRILTNVADKPDLCDFYLGSIVKKGDLKIGISTNGKSPTLAKRLREFLEKSLPDSMQGVLDNMSKIRDSIEGDLNKKIIKLNEVTSEFLSNTNKIK